MKNNNIMYLVAIKNSEILFTTDSKKDLQRYILTNIENIYYVKKDNFFLTLSELESELGMDLFLTRFDKCKELAEDLEKSSASSLSFNGRWFNTKENNYEKI